jgi:Ni/Co efflux regulator RcnB
MKIFLSMCTAVVVSSFLSPTAMAADDGSAVSKQKTESAKSQKQQQKQKQKQKEEKKLGVEGRTAKPGKGG